MQKDYMAMAQQQGVNPQQPPAPGAGDERANVIENLTQLVQSSGMQGEIPQDQLQMMIEELADLIIANDEEGMENNKLYKLLTQMFDEARKMPQAQQGQQQAAPKDFSGMMPPGGGMGGR